jgi:hypothetical protein
VGLNKATLSEECVVELKAGEILAMAGMAVLLLSNMARRRARQGQPIAQGGFARMLGWGDYVAFGLILAGLVVMYLQK